VLGFAGSSQSGDCIGLTGIHQPDHRCAPDTNIGVIEGAQQQVFAVVPTFLYVVAGGTPIDQGDPAIGLPRPLRRRCGVRPRNGTVTAYFVIVSL
jgi:hypothetical protein